MRFFRRVAEPARAFDMRARNPVVMNAVFGAFRNKQRLRITDLGCGSGSTLRALSPKLAAQQNWRLVDYDNALLERAADSAAALNVHVETVATDLDRELERCWTGSPIWSRPPPCSISSPNLDRRLVDEAAQRKLSVYAALSYDGRIEMTPAASAGRSRRARRQSASVRRQRLWPALGPARRGDLNCKIRCSAAFRSYTGRRTGPPRSRIARFNARSSEAGRRPRSDTERHCRERHRRLAFLPTK